MKNPDTDHVRPYNITADGQLRIERIQRRSGNTGTHIEVTDRIVDLSVLTLFPEDTPVIDLKEASARDAAFAREVIGA